MSQEITYSMIEALVESAEIDGDSLRCVFRCPRSGQTEEVRVGMRAANKGSIVSNAKETAQKRLGQSLKRGVLGSISSLLGNGTVGAVARQAAGQWADDVAKRRHHSDEEKERGVVAAFGKTKSFVYDEAEGAFVGRKAS